MCKFREIRYFAIGGKLTGRKSKAMTSPCGKIRIPINESSDDKSQSQEYLVDYRGEGIQHGALGRDDTYAPVKEPRRKRGGLRDTPGEPHEQGATRAPRLARSPGVSCARSCRASRPPPPRPCCPGCPSS